MICRGCKRDEDLRFGWCFDCASQGEKRLAQRTVIQHILNGFKNILKGSRNYKIDFKCAWQRLTNTGDYKCGGYFEREYGTCVWFPYMYKSQCRNCVHYFGVCEHSKIAHPGHKWIMCKCKEYIPSDNLEYLEWQYDRRKI